MDLAHSTHQHTHEPQHFQPVQPKRCAFLKSNWCSHMLAACLVPLMTGLASWKVRWSCSSGRALKVEGHRIARPFLGLALMPSLWNSVSPGWAWG